MPEDKGEHNKVVKVIHHYENTKAHVHKDHNTTNQQTIHHSDSN